MGERGGRPVLPFDMRRRMLLSMGEVEAVEDVGDEVAGDEMEGVILGTSSFLENDLDVDLFVKEVVLLRTFSLLRRDAPPCLDNVRRLTPRAIVLMPSLQSLLSLLSLLVVLDSL